MSQPSDRPPPLPPADSPETGRIIGKWRIGQKLGQGEFGAVYQADHTIIHGLRAAVKFLHPHRALQPEIVQRFLNEACAASCAHHPNIVQVFDGEIAHGGLCYLAMELLTGHTLRDVLKRSGPLDLARTLHVAVQIADALGAVHRLGIIHRDLKPDNVFLSQRSGTSDFITLFDFGIARLRDGIEQSEALHTRSGIVLGTPSYMSPEQWRAQPDLDGRSDIYALGILMYECLSGRPPFRGDLYVCMRAHIEAPVPPLPADCPVPPQLAALLTSMLAKERQARPSTMLAVVAALRAITALPSSSHAPAAPATVVEPSEAVASKVTRVRSPGRWATFPYRRLFWLSVGMAATLLVAFAFIHWFFPGHAASPRVDGATSPPAAPVRLVPQTDKPVTEPPALPAVVPDTAASQVAAPPPGTSPSDAPAATHTVAVRTRFRFVTSISGATRHQQAIIGRCLKDARLPPVYELVLERSGTLHVTRGPQSTLLNECLRASFFYERPPARVVITRQRVSLPPSGSDRPDTIEEQP